MQNVRTTFVNGDPDLVKRGREYLEGEVDTISGFMKGVGDLYEHGLCFDFVEEGTFDDQDEAYYRLQISWGGPSDEYRFYHDGRIEYVFLDWFVGVGFDITDEPWAQWLRENLYMEEWT